MRFLFFYLMTDDPDRVREVAPQHSAYWGRQALTGYLGGPFAEPVRRSDQLRSRYAGPG
jgi:hypothetical protein